MFPSAFSQRIRGESANREEPRLALTVFDHSSGSLHYVLLEY